MLSHEDCRTIKGPQGKVLWVDGKTTKHVTRNRSSCLCVVCLPVSLSVRLPINTIIENPSVDLLQKWSVGMGIMIISNYIS